jgi:replicative DNA helicase
MALSQMSRESERGAAQPREPRLSDLRGSGSIEQDADGVIFMHRTDPGDDSPEDACRKIKIIIAKNRFGPTGPTYLNFFPEKMRFELCASEDRVDEGGAYEPDRFTSRRERLEKPIQPDEDVLGNG